MKQRLNTGVTSLTLIVVVALALRVAFLWNYAQHNPHRALGTIPFLFESGNIAYSLASGHGFSSPFRIDTGPTAWMTPIYPLLLAAIFRIFGTYTFAAFIAAASVNILATAFACIPIYAAGRRIAGTSVAEGAAWLWAVFPNAIQLPATSMWDACIASFLAALILWATIALANQKGSRLAPWIGYGLLWGLALMTSATLLGLVPFLAAWLAYRRRNSTPLSRIRDWLMPPLLAAAVTALCCVPWTARNYRVFHSFVPLRSTLGLQLWVGNNPDARDIWLGTQHPIHDAAERTQYIQLGEIAYMQNKQRDAIQYVLGHPAREIQLLWWRFLAFWSGGTPHPVGDFFRAESIWFRFVLLFNLLLALATIAGIVFTIRAHNPYWFPLAVFPVVFPWAYYLTVLVPRYSLPVQPAAVVLAAFAIDSGARILRKKPFGNRVRN